MRKYFYLILATLFFNIAFAQSWSNVGTGVNGPINAMVVYNGKLYVGGQFTQAGGISAKNIAVWDGNIWDSVGAGLSYVYNNTEYQATVYSLCVFKGCLYVGGYFNIAGNQSVNCLAVLCNSNWYWVNNQLWNPSTESTIPLHMFATDTILYAANGPVVSEYNGSTWPSGVMFCFPYRFGCVSNYASCASLTFYHNTLTIGGFELISTGTIYDNYLAPDTDIVSFDGRRAHVLHANQTTSGTSALMNYRGGLLACSANDSGSGIYLYDGNLWTQFGENFIGGGANCFTSYNGQLFAAGRFKKVGNTAISSIAKWDGTTWQPLGSGVKDDVIPHLGESSVNNMAVYNGKLYVGGYFDSAGGIIANNIACWTEDTTLPDTASIVYIFPNPNNGLFNCQLPHGVNICRMNIYDITGRSVSEIFLNAGETAINIQNQTKAGLYIYRIFSAENKPISTGRFVVCK